MPVRDDLAAALIDAPFGGDEAENVQDEQRISQKVHYEDASYASPGPMPFVCGNCKYMSWGGDQVGPCQIVHGPHRGGVWTGDSCRFFQPRPVYATAAPLEDMSGMEPDGDEQGGPASGRHAEPDGDEPSDNPEDKNGPKIGSSQVRRSESEDTEEDD